AASGGTVGGGRLRQGVGGRIAGSDAKPSGQIEGRVWVDGTRVVGGAAVRRGGTDRLAAALNARQALLAGVETGRLAGGAVGARAAEVDRSVGEASVVTGVRGGDDPGATLSGAAAGLRDRVA